MNYVHPSYKLVHSINKSNNHVPYYLDVGEFNDIIHNDSKITNKCRAVISGIIYNEDGTYERSTIHRFSGSKYNLIRTWATCVDNNILDNYYIIVVSMFGDGFSIGMDNKVFRCEKKEIIELGISNDPEQHILRELYKL